MIIHFLRATRCVISGSRRHVKETFFFRGVMHRRLAVNTDVSGQPIGSSWTALPLKMGPMISPETSVTNYQSTLCKVPEERRSRALHEQARHPTEIKFYGRSNFISSLNSFKFFKARISSIKEADLRISFLIRRKISDLSYKVFTLMQLLS